MDDLRTFFHHFCKYSSSRHGWKSNYRQKQQFISNYFSFLMTLDTSTDVSIQRPRAEIKGKKMTRNWTLM